jgi:hypothetical protein
MTVINAFAEDAVDRAEPLTVAAAYLPSLPPMHSVATRRWPSLRSAPPAWRSSHIWSTSTTSPTRFPGNASRPSRPWSGRSRRAARSRSSLAVRSSCPGRRPPASRPRWPGSGTRVPAPGWRWPIAVSGWPTPEPIRPARPGGSTRDRGAASWNSTSLPPAGPGPGRPARVHGRRRVLHDRVAAVRAGLVAGGTGGPRGPGRRRSDHGPDRPVDHLHDLY